MAESWTRRHSNEWFGRVEKIGDRYVASAAGSEEVVLGSNHATLELAKARSDTDVRRANRRHQCSADCEPWHEG